MDESTTLAILGLALLGLYVYGGPGGSGDGGDDGDAGDSGTDGDFVTSGVGLTASQVYGLAGTAVGEVGVSDVDPLMVTAVAQIESSFDPNATRQEPSINDESVGLCQLLTGTAAWLVTLGYAAYDPTNLTDPATNLYFCVAYLHYLRNYGGGDQTDEFVVRGYNGGPNGITKSATAPYWTSYQQALAGLDGVA